MDKHAEADFVLQADHLTVGYDHHVVVGDVTLDLRPGEIVTLLGPNGAGKSTIHKTVAAQLEPLGGQLMLLGRDLAQTSTRERAARLAVLLTDRPRTELLTCSDVVELGRLPHTGRLGILSEVDRAHVRAAMELVGIEDLSDCDFMQVSDGQRQRVLLARAICQQPRLLLLDEPTSYLDIRHQIELLHILRQLVAAGTTSILMTMHELSLARIVSDWLVCVRDGAVMAQGTPREICVPHVIDALFDLEPGSFDPTTGVISLTRGDWGGVDGMAREGDGHAST